MSPLQHEFKTEETSADLEGEALKDENELLIALIDSLVLEKHSLVRTFMLCFWWQEAKESQLKISAASSCIQHNKRMNVRHSD